MTIGKPPIGSWRRSVLQLGRIATAFIAIAIHNSDAPAATVTYTLDLGPSYGEFSLYAQTSVGDNAGLSFYAVPLMGTVLTLDHRTPITLNAANFQPAGFNILRTYDSPVPLDNPTILAAQGTVSGPLANLIYGFGQQAGTWPPDINPVGSTDPTSDSSWTAPALLATGTYTGSLYFNTASVDLVANVFAAVGSRDTPAASVQTQIVPCLFCPGLMVDDLDLGDIHRGEVVTAKLPGGIDGSDWTLESFTGPNGAVTGATVDFNTGQFSWNSTGAPLGSYSAVIQDLHFEAGVDTGVLTFNLVPEPASATMMISILASGVFIRRLGVTLCRRGSH